MKRWGKAILTAIAATSLLSPSAYAANPATAIAAQETVKHVDPYRYLVYDGGGNPLKGSMIERDGVWYVPLTFIAEALGGKAEYLNQGSQARVLLPGKPEVQTAVSRSNALTADLDILPITEQKRTSGLPVGPIGGGTGLFYVPYDFFAASLGIPTAVVQEGTHQLITIGDLPEEIPTLDTAKPVSMADQAVVRVNGVELPRQGAVYRVDGILYVPLSTPAWEMGGRVEQGYNVEDILNWDRSLSRIRLANEQVIESRLNDTVVTVSGRPVPVLTEQKKTANRRPVSAPVLQIDNGHYVPYDFYKTILKYPVEVRREDGKQIIYVGQIPKTKPVYDLPYRPPYGWMPPKIASKATSDTSKNQKIMENELYFYRNFFIPYGNPSGRNVELYAIRVNTNTYKAIDVSIFFTHWRGSEDSPESEKIPYVARELFKFYLPSKGGNLFKIMDDGYNGKDVSKYVNKPFTLDNRQIVIKEYPRTLHSIGGVEVFIGKPGVKYDQNMNPIQPSKKNQK